jgi:uncharacterized membrane protein YcaP (DUF421 family)
MSQIWQDLFIVGVPVAEKIIRPILVYFFLLIGLRLAGKRELAQLNPFDLVVLLTISNTVQNAIIGDDNSLLGGIIGAITLLVVNWLVARLTYQSETLDRLVEGDAVELITHGKINHDRLKQELLTENELLTAAHHQGFRSLKHLDRAVLERDGAISFFTKTPTPEVQRHQELLERIDKLATELAAMQKSLSQQRS